MIDGPGARRATILFRLVKVALGVALTTGLAACPKSVSKGAPKGLVYVSTEAGGEVVAIDPNLGEIAFRIPVGKRPRGIKVSPDGKLLYVALSGSPRGGPNIDESTLPPADRSADGIGVVDLASRKLLRTIASGQDPEAFDLSHDGKTLYVSNEETAELTVLDLTTDKVVAKVPVGKEPEGVTLSPDGMMVYVTAEADNMVVVVDAVTLSGTIRIPTGARPRAVAFSRDGALAFVTNEQGGTVSVIDTVRKKLVGNVSLGAGTETGAARPMGAVLSTDGSLLFVSTGRGGTVVAIDTETRKTAGTAHEVGGRPWGVAATADGKWLVTANGPSNEVTILGLPDGEVAKRVKVDGQPWGVAIGR